MKQNTCLNTALLVLLLVAVLVLVEHNLMEHNKQHHKKSLAFQQRGAEALEAMATCQLAYVRQALAAEPEPSPRKSIGFRPQAVNRVKGN